MVIQLVDRNQEMCDAWAKEFMGCDDVVIFCGDFFTPETDCIVSPTNSFGFMDGGLDGVITKRLGTQVQKNVQDRIKEGHIGEMLVGQAIIVPTENKKTPYCISAPTMRVSMNIENTVNVYLAAKAIFSLLLDSDSMKLIGVHKVTISGLGTGVGNVPPEICAMQMRQAYDEIWLGKGTFPHSLNDAITKHRLYI